MSAVGLLRPNQPATPHTRGRPVWGTKWGKVEDNDNELERPCSLRAQMLSTVRSSLPRTLRSPAPLSRIHSAAAIPLSRASPIYRLSHPSAVRKPTGVRNMSHNNAAESALRPQPDKVLQDIADYVHSYQIESPLAFETARLCLIDTIGCGLEGLRFDACARLMGPVVEGTVVPNGAYTMIIHSTLH